MARWLGDHARGEWAARMRREVRRGFEVFWDPARNLYRDHRVEGRVRPSVSRHTSAAAVCAGIVPGERLAAIGLALADRTALAHSSLSTEAFEAGRADLVADACRDWSRLLDEGVRTWPESWAGGSRCHGWSSTPTRDLLLHTLGIAPAEPGFTRARVAPALGDLEWAEATVPTPHGPLHVRADASGVEVDSPVPFESIAFETRNEGIDIR